MSVGAPDAHVARRLGLVPSGLSKGMTVMGRPRLYVDFNEMIDTDLVLLAQEDRKVDSAGNMVALDEGLTVHVYMDDVDENGRNDPLIADGRRGEVAQSSVERARKVVLSHRFEWDTQSVRGRP